MIVLVLFTGLGLGIKTFSFYLVEKVLQQLPPAEESCHTDSSRLNTQTKKNTTKKEKKLYYFQASKFKR